MAEQARSHLEKGDRLCSSRNIPMKPKIIKEVIRIHSKCRAILAADGRSDKPLILAARLGLGHMVWGFIECAKQPDPDTNFGGELVSFLGEKNWYGNTALHVAAAIDNVDVVNLLLSYVSLAQLISDRNDNGQTPLSLLGNPKYHQAIFEFLERTTSTDMDAQQESIIDVDSLWQPDYGSRDFGSNNDTVLHVQVKKGNVKYLKSILKKRYPLMYDPNNDGEVPAFTAAKEGQLDILLMMISYFKREQDEIKSLMIRTKDKQSALHIAINNLHVGVVFWLIKEVPGLVHHVNEDKVSPLYVAAKEGHAEIVKLILEKCTIKSFLEPEGGTALHAAASKGSVECIQYLLKSNAGLFYQRDNKKLMPLDVAANNGHVSAAKALLDHDYSTIYVKSEKRNVLTIHIAAMKDHCEILKYLISKCPGCIDVTNREGKNILHVAIENSSIKVIEFIFQQKSLIELINQKDKQGNTPIHLLVAKGFNMKQVCNFDVMKFLTDPRVDFKAINNKLQTPMDMASSEEERTRLLEAISKGPPKWKINEEAQKHLKMMDQIVLVDALIATASFAAAFTVPGGFDGNEGSKQGMPILLQQSAYKAFVVANALAFTFSCSVFFENIRLLFSPYARNRNYGDDVNHVNGRVFAMNILTGMAMVTMVIAFITGTYVVLTPSLGFAISICSMCIFIVVIVYLFAARIGGSVYRIWYPYT